MWCDKDLYTLLTLLIARYDIVLTNTSGIKATMPFTTQFALSLEVAKIVPIQLVIAKSAEAVMNLA